LVDSLKQGLAKTIRQGGTSLKATDFNEDDVKGILRPIDEIEVWQENERDNYGSQSNESLRAKAELINGHLSKVSKQFYEFDTMELGAISAFIDQLQDTLDSIWQDPNISPPFHQVRMEKFFNVVSTTIGARIEQEFRKKENDVWTSTFSDVRVKLNEAMRICRNWKDKML